MSETTFLWQSVLHGAEELNKLRGRVQALEQNTAPGCPAEQKPREHWVARYRDGSTTTYSYRPPIGGGGLIEIVHYREVL
jgi:hypothetical protein